MGYQFDTSASISRLYDTQTRHSVHGHHGFLWINGHVVVWDGADDPLQSRCCGDGVKEELDLSFWNMFRDNCVTQPGKIAKVRYERRKRTRQTHLSLIPCFCASTPLPSLQLQREGTLHFLLLGNTQTQHRNSIWFGNETALVHFPVQTDQSSIASTHGALAGRLRGNWLGKVLPFFIWKGSPCVIFSTWPWENVPRFGLNELWLFFK